MSHIIDELIAETIQFRDERNWEQFQTPRHLAAGLAIEAAELQELFLWKTDDEVDEHLASPEGHQRAREELADVFIFTLLLAEKMGIDLPTAVRDKVVMNAKKYPVEKSYDNARKYTELVG